jgi:hypothetical protein
MPQKKKLKYEKPQSMDIGKAAAVLGDSCSNGEIANPCVSGTDVSNEPYCPNGFNASGNCEGSGSSANKTCYPGSSAGWGCPAPS